MTSIDDLVIEEEEPKAKPTLLGSALWYAEQGLQVFPIKPGTKHPATRNSFKDASTNADQIRTWWANLPTANIGIATGHIIDVIDIDGAPGQRSRVEHWCYDEACRAAGNQVPPPAGWTELCDHKGIFNKIEHDSLGKVLTPRKGGMHIYVPATGDGNKREIFPGVDYRGIGGYVLAPPSRISAEWAAAEGQSPGDYHWLGQPRLSGIS
jgi:hypothetical protein